MIRNNKSQITAFEIPLIFVLLVLVLGYILTSYNYGESEDFSVSMNSFLDSLYYSEGFRELIYQEDINNDSVNGDWNSFEILANNSFSNYEVLISDSQSSKLIHSCNATYEKYYVERVLFIRNSSFFSFRKITFGVCF